MLLEILTPAQRERLEKNQSVDVGYGLTGVARFRCNIFVQRGSYAAVFRRIPFKLPSIAELNLPEVRRRRLPLTMIYRTDHPPGPAGRWLIRRFVEQAEREAAARAA